MKGNIGGIIVEWLKQAKLVQNKIVVTGKTEKHSYLIPTNEVLDSLISTNKLMHLPLIIPMIVKPKPYKREVINQKLVERLGGYLLNDIKITDRLIIDNWELKEASNIKNTNVAYDLVNNMNSVGYKINKDVLNFISKYGSKYNLLVYKENIDNLLEKSKLSKKEKLEVESFLGKLELQENILGLAKVYSNLHEFYLPVRLDFRGRMNCISQYLNYQSNELAKSLLLFSKPEKIMKTDTKAIN